MPTNGTVFPGASVTPEDPRYPTLIHGFNQRWVGRPRSVEVVGDAQRFAIVISDRRGLRRLKTRSVLGEIRAARFRGRYTAPAFRK